MISLYFDEVSNRRIQNYMEQIAKRTGNFAMLDGNVPPHITVSAFFSEKECDAVELFQKGAEGASSGEILWCSVGAFLPRTLYLTPVCSQYLQNLSVQIYGQAKLREGIRVHEKYQPFGWLPHTTVAKHLSQEEMKMAFAVLLEQFGILRGTATEIGLAKTSPYQDICRVKLPDSDYLRKSEKPFLL